MVLLVVDQVTNEGDYLELARTGFCDGELGVVLQANPVEHFLVLFVAGVGEDRFQVCVSPGTAAVLGWARTYRGDAHRVVRLGVGSSRSSTTISCSQFAAEVKGVAEPVADPADQLTEARAALVGEP